MTALTHYFPWDANDTFAYCGYRMSPHDTHSPQPTCADCAARLAVEDAAIDAAVEDAGAVPLDAEEAALAGLRTQRDTLIRRYDAAYDRWLARAGRKPCREDFEDACEELEAEIAGREAALEARDRQEDVVEETMSAFGQALFAFGVTLAQVRR